MKPSIGLLGANGAGKSTIADYLVAEHGYRKLSFAEPLRELAVLNEGWRRALDSVNGDYVLAKEEYPHFRQYLIDLGEGIRKYDPVYFVRALAQRITDMDPERPWVVDDVRMQVEVNFLHDMGFRFVHVVKEPGFKDGKLDIPKLGVELPTRGQVLTTGHGKFDRQWYKSSVNTLLHYAEWALGTPAVKEEKDEGSPPVHEQPAPEEGGGGSTDGCGGTDTSHWCERCELEWRDKLDQLPPHWVEARARWYADKGGRDSDHGEGLGDAPEVRDGEGNPVCDHPSRRVRVVVNPSNWPGDVRPHRL